MKWLASIMWSILLEVLLKSLVWFCNGFIFHIDIPTSSRMIYLSDGSCLCANHFCAMMLCVGATQNSIRVCQVHKIFTIELSFPLYFLIKKLHSFSHLALCVFCSGCFKSLEQQAIWDALERTSLGRKWRKTQNLLVLM